ncbi:Protein kinase-like domain containing protein [Elaphomyces granulatus]
MSSCPTIPESDYQSGDGPRHFLLPGNVVTYMPIEDVEVIGRYRPGGYHPVTIGDQLHAFSTIWLARDLKTNRYVAIKIGVAAHDSQEGTILHQLGKAFIHPILDEFLLTGPNGEHRCFVTVPAGMSLAGAQQVSFCRLLQLPVARAIAAQPVSFLHSEGIVHADLHRGNILLRLSKSLDSITPELIYKRFGKPDLEPVVRLDNQPIPEGVPEHGVLPVISDIWALACTIWTIIGFRTLFDMFVPAKEVIKEHVNLLGKLPLEWWQKWEDRQKWFNEEGERNDGTERTSWEEQFELSVQKPRRRSGMGEISEEEKAALLAMLKAMMAFKPKERMTAEQIKESEWMTKWALPELQKLKSGQMAKDS